MDLVSFDTRGEFEMFAEIMKRGNYVYFSDRQHNLEFEKFSWFGNTIIYCPVLYIRPVTCAAGCCTL